MTDRTESAGRLRRRLTSGTLGSLPVVVGLVLIWVVFYIANPRFISPFNLTNLLLQIAALGIMSVGVVLVLLLGEIDLSIGAVSGFAAGVMAVLNVKLGWDAVPALLAGLATGALVGGLHGFFIARLRVPPFVVTLAGQLGWQGALLWVLGSTGTVNLRDPALAGIAGTFFPDIVGWVLAALISAFSVWSTLRNRAKRIEVGLPVPSTARVAGTLGAVVGAVWAVAAVTNADRGLPLAVLIFGGFVVLFDLITRRTVFGRHLFATGGNEEAARRAGINVQRIRWTVFILASTLAAAGGILASSRLLAVNQSSGGGQVLLNAIAAAVIGGTSLFGGRGSAWSAMLGALVIGSVSNGMDLLSVSSSVKFMITGVVLLLAVTIDSVARRNAAVRR